MPSTSTANPDGALFDNAFYIGMNLQNILYGIYLVLYFRTIRIFLLCRRQSQQSDVFYIVFSSGMLLLITIWEFTAVKLGQEVWLLGRHYPPGLLAYVETHPLNIYMGFGTMATIILRQMTDGLMLYRCGSVWSSLRVITLPSILWLADIALGILLVWTSGTPGIYFSYGPSAKLGLAYYSVSVFLNATLACMICYQLVCHARTVGEDFGDEQAPSYSSIVVLLAESVLPYTLSGIAFLASYGVGSQTAVTFSCVYTLMMCISPQMLILRVVEGRTRRKDTTELPAPMMVFTPGHRDTIASGRSSWSEEMTIHSGTFPNILPKQPERGTHPDI